MLDNQKKQPTGLSQDRSKAILLARTHPISPTSQTLQPFDDPSLMASCIVKLDDPPDITPHPIYASIACVPLSPSVTVHNFSGQPAIADPKFGTPSTPPTFAAQIDICFARIDACLQHLKPNKTDIAIMKYYVVEKFYKYEDDVGLNLVSAKLTEWLEGHRPASTMLVVKGLSKPEFACEFEAVVYLKNEKT